MIIIINKHNIDGSIYNYALFLFKSSITFLIQCFVGLMTALDIIFFTLTLS